ncbi:Neprilysin-4 [Mortierella alpina]|nr:Neprilysin-4 [Mortierella alpina]
MGLGSMVSLSVGFDHNSPILQIFGEGAFFEREFYGVQENIRLYKEEVTKALMDNVHGKLFNASMLLHDTPSSCFLDGVAEDAVDFERQLAMTGLKGRGASMRMAWSYTRAIEKLSTLTPSIDWALLFNEILPVDTNSTVLIRRPPSWMLKELENLLQSTSPRKLQHFLIWLVIRHVSETFMHERWSPDFPQIRRKHCVDVVNWALGHMAGYYLVQQTVERGSLDIVKDMSDSVQKTLTEDLSNAAMLNGSTAEEAIKKISSTLVHVGYATHLQSSESLQEFYKDYDVDPTDYFGNILRSQARIQARSYESLKYRARNLEPYVLPQSLGALCYIHMGANRIFLPAGIMQAPRFYAQGPEYINFGTIGYTVGHELTV